VFVNRGFGAEPKEFYSDEAGMPAAPLPPSLKTPPRPVPVFYDAPADAARLVTVTSGTNVPALEESRLAQRIFDQHQKLKVLAKLRQISPTMLKRAQEFAKFLMAYVGAYSPPYGKLRSDVAANLRLVIRETPGLQGGLGLIPVIIWGAVVAVSAVGAYLISRGMTERTALEVGLQQKEIDAKLAFAAQGKSADEIQKILNSGGGGPPAPGFISQIGGLMQYALWGGLAYVGYKLFLEKKFNRPKRGRRA
jgi:hypothetical protein